MKKQKVKKALIPVAGIGSRLLPITKTIPKEMLPVVDKPILQFIIEEIVAAGIKEILIVVSSTKNAIVDYFDYNHALEARLKQQQEQEKALMLRKIADLAQFYFIRQKEPLGFGHAILLGRSFCQNEPFVVALGDELILGDNATKQCLATFANKGDSVIGVQEVAQEKTQKYGIINPFGEWDLFIKSVQVQDFVEKPALFHAPSNYAAIGRYVFTPQIFSILNQQFQTKQKCELDVSEALAILCSQKKVYARLIHGQRYDISNQLDYVKAIVTYALKQKEYQKPLLAYLQTLLKQKP